VLGPEGAAVERRGRRIVPLRLEQEREIVHAGERVGVVRSEDALAGVEGPPGERRGRRVVTLGLEQAREIGQASVTQSPSWCARAE
jgi:hypothetical protein